MVKKVILILALLTLGACANSQLEGFCNYSILTDEYTCED